MSTRWRSRLRAIGEKPTLRGWAGADCWNDRHDSRRTGQAPLVLPEEACQRRVTRGGDWYYIPALATTSARMGNFSVLASYTIGFRVAREIPATK